MISSDLEVYPHEPDEIWRTYMQTFDDDNLQTGGLLRLEPRVNPALDYF